MVSGRYRDIDRLIKTSAQFRQAHSSAASRMGNGYMRCENCDAEIKLDVDQVERYLRQGWPKCCVGTLKGGTMGFFEQRRTA